ncbi:MAG: PQQ-dependent catabolism-associated beta-propeller protein [Burkholderiales bacterium]|nr:PQQ-dependent catabolism-associated beta-propeller protein [Burkholderiales bacterium]
MKRISATGLALAFCAFALPAQAQGVAYVSSEKDATLTLIDLKSQAVTGTLPTCKRPRYMQTSPDGRQLIVACSDSNEADVIDLATRKSVRRFALGEDPEVFDIAPDGHTLFVGREDDGELAWVDMANGKQLKSVQVGKEPEGVKVTPDGKTVYVACEASNLVSVVDVASATVRKNIAVAKRPRRFALTPDGRELWVTSELGAAVTIVSTRDNSILATIHFEVPGARDTDITPVGITMTRDGRHAFVALGKANRVAFVDVAKRKVEHLVLVGKRVWSVALNKAETRLYAVNGLSDDVTIIDVAGAKALKSVPVGRTPYMAVIVE